MLVAQASLCVCVPMRKLYTSVIGHADAAIAVATVRV
jgi:hypothetical protein